MSNFLELAQALQMAIKALQMYTAAHPRSQEALAALSASVAGWLKDRPELQMTASAGKVFMDGAPVEGTSLHLTALIRQLTERQIAGFIIKHGVSTEELLAMLQILILKPAKLEEMGGVAKVVADKNLYYISLSQTQYREVREGEGGDEDHGGAQSGQESGSTPPPEPPTPKDTTTPLLLSIAEALQQWREQLIAASLLSNDAGAESGMKPPAFLGHLGPMAEAAGWGETFPSAPQMESLRQALGNLPGETQLAILRGMSTLPKVPGGLRMGFQALAPEIVALATADLLAKGTSWNNLKESLSELVRLSPQKQALLTSLEASLVKSGLSPAQAQELLRQLEWEGQPLEERIRKALEEDRLWDLSLEQRLSFMRELLEQGRTEPFLRILDLVLAACTEEDPHLREIGVLTLAGITHWLIDPGLPLEAEGPILESLSANFGWEPLPYVHRSSEEGLGTYLACFLKRGEVAQAQTLLQDLQGLCAFLEEKQEWRDQGLERLKGILTRPEAVSSAVEAMHRSEPETALSTFLPYFEFLGESGSQELIRLLGEEPERKRRGRLLDVIRALGPLALLALQESLSSPVWYLVRNTLNLLADMGDAGMLSEVAGCLKHPDGRVKRAAVRALWKLGGPACAPHLLPIFPTGDPETQIEILFGLGQVQSVMAVPVLAEALPNPHLPERVRLKLAETLGQIGNPGAIPALVELVRRKGRIFTSAEPTELRLAAARALVAIGTSSAMDSMKKLVEDEPRSKDKDALQGVLIQSSNPGQNPGHNQGPLQGKT